MNHEEQMKRSAEKFASAGNKPLDEITEMLDKGAAYIQHNLKHSALAYDHNLPGKTIALALVKLTNQLDELLKIINKQV